MSAMNSFNINNYACCGINTGGICNKNHCEDLTCKWESAVDLKYV